VLKHPGVEQVVQVDIDEVVTRAAEQYFPELCESNQDPRAQLHFADGIAWVQNAAPASYDIIIVDSTPTRFREQDAAAKPFATDYYNVDIHRTALATPEFMQRALTE